MGDKTVINPNINSTIDSSDKGQTAAINTEINEFTTTNIPIGTILADKYQVIAPLNVSNGEADLFICKRRGIDYVAKVYRGQREIKSEVIFALRSITSPYVASLHEIGRYQNRQFEILTYYKNGSLQNKTFTLNELKKTIIPCINEALKALHSHFIFHKDLKPSNIMLLNDNKNVAIIDFGISSVIEDGNAVVMTKTCTTSEYSAPETFNNLFLKESDYYSFGITLFELYCGHTPYKGMSERDIAKFTAMQRIPLPNNMPKELQDLISALTYYDISNRKDKKNPNRRWTYDEVKKWCEGVNQIIPGENTGTNIGNVIPTYTFLKKEYQDIPSLIIALASNWNDGKKHLYRGSLSAFFKNFNPEIAGYCMDAEEAATRTTGKDDIIFCNLLYKIYPELNGFYWLGQTYESLPALGRDMLERLWKNDKSNYAYWDSILNNKLLSNYLSKVKSKNANSITDWSTLETSHNTGNRSMHDTMMNYYRMAYLLSGQKLFAIGEKRLKNVTELTAHMKKLLDSSYEEFEDFCHSLITYDNTLDAQFEAWLIALGKRNEIESWRNQLVQ